MSRGHAAKKLWEVRRIRSAKKSTSAVGLPRARWELNESLELIDTRKKSRIHEGQIRFSEALVAHILISLQEKGEEEGLSIYEIWKICRSAPLENSFTQPAIYKTVQRLTEADLAVEIVSASKTGKKPKKKFVFSDDAGGGIKRMIRQKLNRFMEREREIREWKEGLDERMVSLDTMHLPMNHILILDQILPLVGDESSEYTIYVLWKQVEKSLIIEMTQPAFYKIMHRLIEEGLLRVEKIGKRKIVRLAQMDTGRLEMLAKQVSEYKGIEERYLDCYF